MLSTRYICTDINQVPSAWVFQNYCRLNEKLEGQDVKIRSLFNPKDRNPSMVIYINGDGNYKFNDFSTGIKGDKIDLVKELFHLQTSTSIKKINSDYQEFLKSNKTFDNTVLQVPKYKITSWETRGWNKNDEKYWTAFHIGSRLLKHYNVTALKSYSLSRADDQIVISKPYLYGFFKKDGSLYKIYQPFNKERKFLKLGTNYIQGTEQLKKNPFLLITSSLKDIMAIRSLQIANFDYIAPDSENVMISDEQMKIYKTQYQQIITLFDSDEAGILAMQKYKEKHGLNLVYFDMAKDPSDAIKKHGAQKVKEELVIKLNAQLDQSKPYAQKERKQTCSALLLY